MTERPSLVERLRIAKEAHAKAEEATGATRTSYRAWAKGSSRGAGASSQRGVVQVRVEPPPDIQPAPLCGCGCKKVECPDCREHYCRANGHARHVCAAFSQVEVEK